MHEKAKLEEARHNYERMIQDRHDSDSFKYSLRAFLSSARSVLLYAKEEVIRKGGGDRQWRNSLPGRWYNSLSDIYPALKFLGKKRNADVHLAPVSPVKHIGLEFTASIRMSESLDIKLLDAEGNVKEEYKSPPTPEPAPEPERAPIVTTTYYFSDWKGPEDVLTLCKRYLDELEAVINNGIAETFLTPS